MQYFAADLDHFWDLDGLLWAPPPSGVAPASRRSCVTLADNTPRHTKIHESLSRAEVIKYYANIKYVCIYIIYIYILCIIYIYIVKILLVWCAQYISSQNLILTIGISCASFDISTYTAISCNSQNQDTVPLWYFPSKSVSIIWGLHHFPALRNTLRCKDNTCPTCLRPRRGWFLMQQPLQRISTPIQK